MDSVRQYFLTVCTAAILCAAIGALAEKKGGRGNMVKVLCGLFLTFTVIQPWGKLKWQDLSGLWNTLAVEADAAVSVGQNQSRQALAEVIKNDTQSYILDRASSMGLTLSVDVTLSQDTIPVPVSVCLRGAVSPQAKSKLQQFISDELGIGKEQQLWISQ